MDVTAAPSWESGLVPNKENLAAASWAKFAQMNVSSAVAASTEAKTISGVEPGEVYWAGLLAMQPPVRRLAAWERVPTAAKSQRFPGTIMKRVALSNPGESSPYNMRASAEARSATDAPSSWRMKLLHRPWDGLKQHEGFKGGPLSEASMTSLRMQSRVGVANALLAQAAAAKPPTYESEYKVVPLKRSLGVAGVGLSERAMPGNRLPTYIEIRPLLEKAEADGVLEIDMAKASFAHSTEILHNLHRNPRTHLAAHGLPDLSCITDHTEPSSPPVMSPPRSTTEAKSPTKRDPIPSSPLQSSCNRLKAAKIDLLPAPSPKAEPSPTKSASPPATPLKDVLVTPKLTITPSAFAASLGSYSVVEEDAPRRDDVSYSPLRRASSIFSFSEHLESSPAKRATSSPGKRPWSAVSTPQSASQQPASAFKMPSFLQDPTSLDSPAQGTEFEPSPTKLDRPVGPTPSKWNRCEFPSTPLPASPTAIGRIDTPVLKFDLSGLEAGAPAFQNANLESPAFPVDVSAIQAFSPVGLADFDFGSSTMSFDTRDAGMMEPPTEPKRLKNLFASRRRQSEPLYRNAFKVQKRRRTASPEKLGQKATAAADAGSLTPTPKPASEAAQDGPVEDVQTPRTPGALAHGNETATPCVDNVVTGTPSVHVTPAAEQATTTPAVPDASHATSNRPGVLNIDVRQNPDIFGIHRQDHAVNRLAQMADTYCDGHANVVVSQENGRLIVRFKLPTEYASLFPDSQGFDQSRFTTSPSMASSSPQIRFDNTQSTPKAPAKIPTLSYNDPTRPIKSSPLKQSPVTRSPAEPQSAGSKSALWGPKSTQADPDATYIVTDFDSPAAKSTHGPPDAPQAETPLPSQRVSELPSPGLSILETPTMSGVGVVNRDTPEHLRFSVLGTPFQEGAPAQTPTTATQTPLNFQSPGLSILETPTMSGIGAVNRDTPEHLRFSLQTPLPGTPAQASSFQTASTPAGGPSTDQATCAAKSSLPAPEPETPVVKTEATSPDIAESVATQQAPEGTPSVGSPRTPPPADALESTTPTSSPPLNLAFTPVNQHSPRRESVKASPEAAPVAISTTAPAEEEHEEQVPSAPIVAASPARVVDDDSPGREYMREFIKRSKPKRLSTLENGSPVAQPAERMPLGAKSPNAASPQKGKRKADDSREDESPIRKSIEPVPKRTRRTVRAPKNKGAKDIDELAANGPEDDADDDADMDAAPTTRRSSRLRVLGQGTTANSRSAIPTPIKLRQGPRGSAAGSAVNATVRSEQQDLMHQTRLNTRRNKGNAEYPAQVLARRSQELQEDEDETREKTGEQSKSGKDRKSVVWKEPLEAHQEKPKRGRAAAKTAEKTAPKTEKPAPKTEKPAPKMGKPAPKTVEKTAPKTEKSAPKPTQQASGIAKPRKTAVAKKAEAAEARPQRVTRSRARSQA